MPHTHSECVVHAPVMLLWHADIGGEVHKELDLVALRRLRITCSNGKLAVGFDRLASAALQTLGARRLVQSAVRRGDLLTLDWVKSAPGAPSWPWSNSMGDLEIVGVTFQAEGGLPASRQTRDASTS